MGLNLHCCRLGRVCQSDGEHPLWDRTRYRGDWTFLDFLYDTKGMLETSLGEDGESYHRPADIPAARLFVEKMFVDFTKDRLLSLLDILEQEPTYWLYASS